MCENGKLVSSHLYNFLTQVKSSQMCLTLYLMQKLNTKVVNWASTFQLMSFSSPKSGRSFLDLLFITFKNANMKNPYLVNSNFFIPNYRREKSSLYASSIMQGALRDAKASPCWTAAMWERLKAFVHNDWACALRWWPFASHIPEPSEIKSGEMRNSETFA